MKNLLIIITLLLSYQLQANECLLGDCINGFGIQKIQNNNQYLGEFKNGLKSGQGVYYYSKTIKYVGSWKNDVRNGEGRMYLNDQVTQEGVWENNRIKIAQANVGCIDGDCENNIGTFLYKDGRKLFGAFRNGKPIGKIICYYPDGQKYIGKWANDEKGGEGSVYKKDGTVITGIWNKNQFLGEMKNKLTGCLNGDCINGKGTYIYSDLTRYNGGFNNNLANGFGVCYYADGDIYIGEWKNHNFNGYGTMYFNNGTTIEGVWKNGIYQEGSSTANTNVFYDLDDEESIDDEPKIWVVLVGVSRYTTMQSLKYTDDDAFKLYSFFKSPEGGALPDKQLRLLIDEAATKDEILKNLDDFAQKSGKNDAIMFFFSGHGVDGAFLPSDYDGRNQVVKHKDLLDIIENSKAKSKIIIADACHSGSFTAKRQNHETTINTLYSAFSNSRGGTLLLLSSKAEETSIESNGLRQGVFSHFLITGLNGHANTNSDKIITVKEIYDYVYTNVRFFTNNRQTPVIRGNFDENMPMGTIRF